MTATPVSAPADTRRDLRRYFLVAYAVSWLLWAPLVFAEAGWIDRGPPEWWHYAGAAGPITGAIVASSLAGGRGAVRALLAQFDPRRVTGGWWGFAVFSPIALFAAGALTLRLVEGTWPHFAAVSRTGNLPVLALPLTWLIHTLTFGVGEETGWRGFALPRLEREHRSPLRATVVLTVFWAAWHIPAFVYNDNLRGLGAGGTAGWLLGLFAAAIFFTWLYHRTHGGLLAIVIWHGTFNTLVASEAAEGTIAAAMTTVFMIAVALIVVLGAPTMLGRHPDAAGPRPG
ncbi:MAG: CPBP family intramembrane metalloprotease, partial [Chloroflexi bacterium]|nr:CPBP family intramembrane metalloprotease [Chloroflexota bacterium]